MTGLEPLPPPLRGCPQGHKGKSPCADTVYQMCYFSWYLVRKNGSPVTPVCQIAKLSSHLVQRLSAPRGRIWRPPSDGDVPRNDRPPSKTAFFDGNVPFFCRLPSLGTRTPPSSFREREKPAVIYIRHNMPFTKHRTATSRAAGGHRTTTEKSSGQAAHSKGAGQRTNGIVQRRSGGPLKIVKHRIGL